MYINLSILSSVQTFFDQNIRNNLVQTINTQIFHCPETLFTNLFKFHYIPNKQELCGFSTCYDHPLPLLHITMVSLL